LLARHRELVMSDGSRLALDHPRSADQKDREQKRRDAEAEDVADGDGDGAVVIL